MLTRQVQELAVKAGDLSADLFAHRQERSNSILQMGVIVDQFLHPATKDIASRLADDQAKILEQSANLIAEITLDLLQQGPAVQHRTHDVTR